MTGHPVVRLGDLLEEAQEAVDHMLVNGISRDQVMRVRAVAGGLIGGCDRMLEKMDKPRGVA